MERDGAETAGAQALEAATRRCCGRMSGWTPAGWAARCPSGGTRADLAFGLVQRVADLAADAEGQPRRRVPRPDSDLVIGDQLRVVVADLVAASPQLAVLAEAAAAVDRAHTGLVSQPLGT